MIPWHVVSGMSGVVMVLRRKGLTDRNGNPLHYDRVYYVGENDFYVPRDEKGKFKSYASAADGYADTMEVMRKLVPTHVVFNGRVGALTGKNALTARVGETVLIVHSEANRDSRPHMIGGHGDYVWETGKWSTVGTEVPCTGTGQDRVTINSSLNRLTLVPNSASRPPANPGYRRFTFQYQAKDAGGALSAAATVTATVLR